MILIVSAAGDPNPAKNPRDPVPGILNLKIPPEIQKKYLFHSIFYFMFAGFIFFDRIFWSEIQASFFVKRSKNQKIVKKVHF